ncbi:MAG: hypothetical protein R2824_27865 [Saprospiraceae bacterium]|nr:hypothetical protein [Lewinella sp.]
MEYQQIKTLLDRYFAGETTLQEERLLRRYFSGENVDQRLREYAPFFQVLVQEKDRRLSGQKAESIKPARAGSSAIFVRYRQWMARAAAVILVAVGLWWAYSGQQSEVQTAEVDWSKYEITDEQEALRITQGALFRVSKTLNDGAKAAASRVDRMQEMGKFFK